MKGVIFIQDLKTEEGSWITYNEFKTKYDIHCTYMKYRSLLGAVMDHTAELRRQQIYLLNRPPNVEEDSKVFKTIFGGYINVKITKAKEYYDLFVSQNVEPPIAINRWKTLGINEDKFYKSMELARQSTKEQKLISTHYKIINNVWPSNEKLFKWKIKPDNKCHYCDEIDTIEHAMCECTHTKRFLYEVLRQVDRNRTFIHELTPENVIFGIENKSINTILLLLKEYIGTRRCMQVCLNSQIFIRILCIKLISERKYFEHAKFATKWENFPWLLAQADTYANTLKIE